MGFGCFSSIIYVKSAIVYRVYSRNRRIHYRNHKASRLWYILSLEFSFPFPVLTNQTRPAQIRSDFNWLRPISAWVQTFQVGRAPIRKVRSWRMELYGLSWAWSSHQPYLTNHRYFPLANFQTIFHALPQYFLNKF